MKCNESIYSMGLFGIRVIGWLGYTVDVLDRDKQRLNENPIDQLLSDLQRNTPLIDVLLSGVRHACRLTGCIAGVFTSVNDSMSTQHWWIVHDPGSVIRHIIMTDQGAVGSSRLAKPVLALAQPDLCDSHLRSYQVQLTSDHKAVGYIILWSNHDIDMKDIMKKLRPLDSLLALVGVALNGILSCKKLFDHYSFREHVANEINRTRRTKKNFSIIHTRMQYDRFATGNELTRLWQNTITMGETILSWFRKSDTLGVISPYRFAVLLPATTIMGAKIASRRVHELLTAFTKPSSTTQGLPQMKIVSYPMDAGDVEKLCEVTAWPNPLDSKKQLSQATK